MSTQDRHFISFIALHKTGFHVHATIHSINNIPFFYTVKELLAKIYTVKIEFV